MNYFLWTIGVFMLFVGMCMQECDGNTFILQLALVVVGSLIAFAGYIREELKNERDLRDKRRKANLWIRFLRITQLRLQEK